LLVAARRVRDVQDRLQAIVRAYVQPAFSSSSDLAGGGARFTRLSRGEADGADMAEAIEQLVAATVASLQASDVDHIDSRAKPAQRSGAKDNAAKRTENPAD